MPLFIFVDEELCLSAQQTVRGIGTDSFVRLYAAAVVAQPRQSSLYQFFWPADLRCARPVVGLRVAAGQSGFLERFLRGTAATTPTATAAAAAAAAAATIEPESSPDDTCVFATGEAETALVEGGPGHWTHHVTHQGIAEEKFADKSVAEEDITCQVPGKIGHFEPEEFFRVNDTSIEDDFLSYNIIRIYFKGTKSNENESQKQFIMA